MEKRRISELLVHLHNAVQLELIDSIEHTPEWYQIHVIFPQRQSEHTREQLKAHILQTYRDIVKVEATHPSSILIEYRI